MNKTEICIENWLSDLVSILPSYHNREVLDKLRDRMETELDQLIQDTKEDCAKKYNELLMAVTNKYTNQTRHETALRYIKYVDATLSNAKGYKIKDIIEHQP